MAQNAKSFPGRLTLEQWLALPFIERVHLVHQAQCDLWGSFRYCRRKNCRRHRTCLSREAYECAREIKIIKRRSTGRTGEPKTMRREWSRLYALRDL